ncbi:hypothetical protein Efla_004809 [Eimeria flavescens]
MEVELCVLQLLQGGGLTVRPVAAEGTLLPAELLQIRQETEQETQQVAAAAGAAALKQHETLLLLPLLRRVPGAPLGPQGKETIRGGPLRLRLPVAACGDTTAADLWGRASGLLLQYLLQQQQLLLLHQRRVVELGCGLGAPSCLCWLLGAPRVHATDHDAAAVSLASCNLRLCCLLQPEVTSAAAAAAGAASALAAAAARCLDGLRTRKQQQQLYVSDLLHALPGAPGASSGLLAWSEEEQAVLQQLQQELPAAGGPTPSGSPLAEGVGAPTQGGPFNLVLAADVLYSDKGAAALACTIRALARRAASPSDGATPRQERGGAPKEERRNPPAGAPPFLCLVSHQVRHAVYLHAGAAAKEMGDSALRCFLSAFMALGPLAEAQQRKSLRPGDDPPPPAAAAAAAAAAAPAAAAGSQLYVRLMATGEGDPGDGEGTLPEDSVRDSHASPPIHEARLRASDTPSSSSSSSSNKSRRSSSKSSSTAARNSSSRACSGTRGAFQEARRTEETSSHAG